MRCPRRQCRYRDSLTRYQFSGRCEGQEPLHPPLDRWRDLALAPAADRIKDLDLGPAFAVGGHFGDLRCFQGLRGRGGIFGAS
jgi:hypothetical protein